MKKVNLFSENVYSTVNAQGVKANGFIFLTEVGKNPKTNKMEVGMASQAKRIMENVKTILEENGSSIQNIVKVTVFLSDLGKAKEFNDIYYSYFKNEKSRPVRCCIQAGKLSPGLEAEVEFIALA
jgi:2-iminobutanoate/2-iminopropanoate deaminase